MRRAYLLIILLTVAAVGLGLWADLTQRSVARDYLHQTETLRRQVKAGEMEAAEEAEASIHAKWDKDSLWLNCLIDHHHTRAVSTAFLQLSTALEMGWADESMKALDLLQDAFTDIGQSDFPHLYNVL